MKDHITQYPSVVYHCVDATKTLYRCRHQGMSALPCGDTGAVGNRLTSFGLDCIDHFLCRAEATTLTTLISTQVVDHYTGAFTCSQFGDFRPHTTTGTGYDDHFAFQKLRHLKTLYIGPLVKILPAL
ncbi:hypothetical protein D3C87_1815700 [compost metagenome]